MIFIINDDNKKANLHQSS